MTCVTLLLVYIFSVLNTFWVRKKRNTLKPQFFFHPHFPSLKHEKGNRNDVPLLFPCILVQNFIPQIKTRFHIYRALTLRSKTFWRSKFATPIMFLVFQSCPNPTFLLIFERSSCLTKESSKKLIGDANYKIKTPILLCVLMVAIALNIKKEEIEPIANTFHICLKNQPTCKFPTLWSQNLTVLTWSTTVHTFRDIFAAISKRRLDGATTIRYATHDLILKYNKCGIFGIYHLPRFDDFAKWCTHSGDFT